MTREVTETRKTQPQYRHFAVDRKAINDEARTVELAFSSEEPYDRYFGTEILDHAPASIRLGRLKNAGALLLDHDPRRHIGVVEKVAIGEDRVGRAVVRFGRNAEADAAWKDVQDGIRQHVSVGYFIHRMTLEEEREGHETYRVNDWEPIEVSLVAIPADPSVGVGRSQEPDVSTIVVRHVADPDPKQQPTTPRITMTTETKEGKPADTQVSPADLERARASEITKLGEQYAKFVSDKDVGNAIRNGHSAEQFKDLVMAKMEARHTDTSELHIGMQKKEVQRYSLARAVVASVTGDWSQAGLEREASAAVAKMLGRAPEGFFVPFDAFKRDFNVGTSTEAGNLVQTDMRGDMFVDALRNALVMSGLGIRILAGVSNNLDLPRKATASTIGMLTEIGSASETNPLTTLLSLRPKRMGAYVDYSKQALIQSALAIEPMLRDDLIQGAAVLLENQMINGAGTGAEIRGVRNTSGIGTVVAGANGATVAWSHLVDLESNVANANSEPDRLAGYLTNTKVRGRAKQVTKSTNLPFIWVDGGMPLNGYRAAITNNVPSNLTKGTSTTVCSSALFGSDWSMWVLALFGAPDIVVDPYTLAAAGQVRITLNQFADAGARQPAAFAKVDDLLT